MRLMQARKTTLFALLSALLFIVAACCPCRKYQRLYGAPLVGTEWQLIQLNGNDINPSEGEGAITLHFDSRKALNGYSGCNRYQAGCEAETDGHLHIGPIATTRMTCPQAAREAEFLEVLRNTVRYELDAKMLILSDSVGVRAIFQAGSENGNNS